MPYRCPIRVLSSKRIFLILKCLYQRSPLASWNRVIGVDIRVLFGRTQTILQRLDTVFGKTDAQGQLYFITVFGPHSWRNFNNGDTQNAPGVAIINQAMARGFWPEEPNALGQRIIWGDPERRAEIVGVVEDVRSWATQPSVPHIYVPFSQSWSLSDPHPYFDLWKWKFITFAIRTHSNPAALAAAARNAIKEENKSQSVEWVRTMDQVISGEFEPWRVTMLLLGLFAGLAVLLSAIGIYGVISYAVADRTHEIGVRMVLGARPTDVLRMVMKGGFWLTLAGILLGSIAAYWLTRVLSSHLYEVEPNDPLTFVCVAIVLMGVAMVACYLPARRAASQDPMAALRCE
jgi:putative ABC transport system permease protein